MTTEMPGTRAYDRSVLKVSINTYNNMCKLLLENKYPNGIGETVYINELKNKKIHQLIEGVEDSPMKDTMYGKELLRRARRIIKLRRKR